jgi:hypothetical protein
MVPTPPRAQVHKYHADRQNQLRTRLKLKSFQNAPFVHAAPANGFEEASPFWRGRQAFDFDNPDLDFAKALKIGRGAMRRLLHCLIRPN